MQTIDKSHIEKRLDDWKQRIESLYKHIDEWLDTYPRYRFEVSSPVTLDEEMMHKLDVEKIQLPTANIFKDNNLLASLKPKGLWVIGANGRVDLISKSKPISLLDVSEQFQSSEWQIAYSKNRQKRLPLNKSNFLKVLNSL